MSNITNAVLMHGNGEIRHVENAATFVIADELQRAMEKAGIITGKFVRVDGYAVFYKGMTAPTYVAGFNHLNERTLVDTIRSLLWERPDEVQLFIKRESEDHFVEITLFQDEPTATSKRNGAKGMGHRGSEQQEKFRASAFDRWKFYRREIMSRALNPLSSEPLPQWAAEEKTTLPWLFEVTEREAEYTWMWRTSSHDRSRLSINREQVGHIERAFQTILAYQGYACEMTCSTQDLGENRYDEYKRLFSALSIGDWIEFSGLIAVNEAGIWELLNIESIGKHNSQAACGG